MLVLCNRKLKRINTNGKIQWSIDFTAPGWSFLFGMGATLVLVLVYAFVSYIEM